MSIAELFDGEFRHRMKGRFAAVVRVLFADEGKFDPEEKAFLDKLAVKLGIDESEYQEILEDPMKYPLDPPHLYEDRLESLYNITKVIHLDHHLGDRQETLLRKFVLALGFHHKSIEEIAIRALELADAKVDLDTFILEMQHLNKHHQH